MNLLELRSWLQEQTLTPQADATVDGYLNQAYLELATAHDWPWLETTDSFVQEEGVAEYELPIDLNQLRAVVYTGQGAAAQPTRTTRESVLARFGDDVGDSALPTEFYRANTNLVFVPTPSGAQDVVLVYRARPIPLTDDEDEPLFDAAFHVYLAQAAAALYFESEESYEYAGYYHSKAADTFARLAEFYNLQMPPEQPLIIGEGRFRPRPKPFTNWPDGG